MRIRGIILSVALFLWAAISVERARAGNLILTYDGATGANSSLNGTPISPGTGYEIQAVFSDTLIANPVQGVGVYQPISITATLGGTTYTELIPGNFSVRFADPTYVGIPGDYAAALDGAGPAFAPVFTTATPALVATAASPTVFSGYNGYLGFVLNMSTAGGVLGLDFDTRIGVSASISSIPEPRSVVLTGTALLAGLGMRLRRRRA